MHARERRVACASVANAVTVVVVDDDDAARRVAWLGIVCVVECCLRVRARALVSVLACFKSFTRHPALTRFFLFACLPPPVGRSLARSYDDFTLTRPVIIINQVKYCPQSQITIVVYKFGKSA